MNSLIKIVGKNIRTEKDGYYWGKPPLKSNILNDQEREEYKNFESIAERWICSDDIDYPSFVDFNGAKLSLNQLFKENALDIFGQRHFKEYGPYLGTIMKLLDTNDQISKGSLSLQVHPDISYTSLPAKPEMWISLSYKTKVYLGWMTDLTKQELLNYLENNTIFDKLNSVSLNVGEKLLIDGGVVHAIRYGSFLAEWSCAPFGKNIEKGSLKKASVALADDTDGKIPRSGKVDLPLAIKILEHVSYGLKKLDVSKNIPEVNTLFIDKKGNCIKEIFRTFDICVEEILVKDKISLKNKDKLSCLFLYNGDVDINYLGRTEFLKEDSEVLLPFYIKEAEFVNKSSKIVRIYRWYKP